MKHASDDYKKSIARFKERLAIETGHTILEFVINKEATPAEIYANDIEHCVATADIIIADITHPSLGAGYEIATMIEALHKPVIGIAQQGAEISKLMLGALKGMVFYYGDEEEMFQVAKKGIMEALPVRTRGKFVVFYGINNLGKST